MKFVVLVTGPPYGTQAAISAWMFANAVINNGYILNSVFFHREGVLNANQLIVPSNDEHDLVRNWIFLKNKCETKLNICVSAALRRGILDKKQAQYFNSFCNLQEGFQMTGLTSLMKSILHCDRMVQF